MSFSSRLTNIIGSYVPALGRAGTRHQVEQYRSSNGKKGSKFLGCPCFLLDVVGRRSGESHPVMLIHVPRGDDLIVVGSGAGAANTPNWYKNLSWRPEAVMCRSVLTAGASKRASFRRAPSATSAGGSRSLATLGSKHIRRTPSAGFQSRCSGVGIADA